MAQNQRQTQKINSTLDSYFWLDKEETSFVEKEHEWGRVTRSGEKSGGARKKVVLQKEN
jgi:hypothetical protein